MSAIKLTYFNFMGKAEPARLILAYAGVDYKDERITMDEWKDFKAKTPFGQLPILEIDGKVLCQSMAIDRYLARKYGLCGQDDFESARCDMLADGVEDVSGAMRPFFMEQDEAKKKEIQSEIMKTAVHPAHARYENFLTDNGTGYFVGKQITWADLILYQYFSVFQKIFGTLDSYPKLKEFTEKIGNLAAIKKWIETRPKTEF